MKYALCFHLSVEKDKFYSLKKRYCLNIRNALFSTKISLFYTVQQYFEICPYLYTEMLIRFREIPEANLQAQFIYDTKKERKKDELDIRNMHSQRNVFDIIHALIEFLYLYIYLKKNMLKEQ